MSEDEGLPTAAYETIFPENIGGWSAHRTEHLANQAIENAETEAIKNELYRAEDVEALIEEKIDVINEEITRLENKIDRPEPDVAKIHHEFQKNLLEELLEEVKASE